MTNYEDIGIRAVQGLRAFARAHGEADFARMATVALGCLISDAPAAHSESWTVERVRRVLGLMGLLGEGGAATIMPDPAKLELIRSVGASPPALEYDAVHALRAFAELHGNLPFAHLAIAALPSERGPAESWAVERIFTTFSMIE